MKLQDKVQSAYLDTAFSLLTLSPPSPGFPPLEKHPLALEKRRILHPFLGEMGLEIRGFLGSIEPWLRSGWIIPARRPALYAPECAFDDPVYFKRVNEIRDKYELREMVSHLEHTIPLPINSKPELADEQFKLTITSNLSEPLSNTMTARRDLRRAFWERYGHDELIPTHWHFDLSSQSMGDDHFEETARSAIVPGYLPSFFQNPPFDFPKHIGIQLRNMPKNPARNSNPERMARLASQAAAILDLPVIVYGRDEDFPLPGAPRTIDLIPPGTPQMNAELALLKNCALMIAPDSGWTDLMGWLRVPTLLERLHYPWGFEGLRPFSPRIALADDTNLRASIEAVMASGAECVLPDPTIGESQSDFLNPAGPMCQSYWDFFKGGQL